MWLLNATTKHLKPFLPDQVPPYAILSHTWDPTPDNEVLFSDFSSSAEASCGERVPLEQQPSARLKRSWRKVELTCAQALCDGYAWVWIDTCCIDKSSSSELSEAINSMYAWYRDSGVCYAYLSDVPANVCLKLSRLEFRRSRWFTRGWTLQELLAPSKLVFFVDKEETEEEEEEEEKEKAMAATPGDGGWRSIGEKTELSDLVASITGIDIDILVDRELLCSASIAQRMSWASCRVTSRPEDMAYCLMGLFGVHMPMLYGEGAEKAFLRLQEEIMASSVDQSLFAWRDEDAATRPSAKYGLLASSPLSFRDSSRIVPYQDWQCRPPYQMTNRGLQVELPLAELEDGKKDLYFAVLDCPVPPDYEDHCFLTIFLEKLPGSEVQFARVRAHRFGQAWHPGETRQIYVRQQQRAATKPTGLFPKHIFQMRNAAFLGGSYKAIEVLIPPGAEVKEMIATQKGKKGVTETNTITATTATTTTQWIPDQKPQAFRIGKVPWAQVAGAILFERGEDGERLLVRFGSAGRAKVAFDAVRQLSRHRVGKTTPTTTTTTTTTTEELDQSHLRGHVRHNFVPRQSGQSVDLRHHRVRVDFAEPQVHGGSKYILVDLEIEALSFADRTPPPARDATTLLCDDALGTKRTTPTSSTASTGSMSTSQAPKKIRSTWRRLIAKHIAPKEENMKPPAPPASHPSSLVVRRAASAGTLRELSRWDGED